MPACFPSCFWFKVELWNVLKIILHLYNTILYNLEDEIVKAEYSEPLFSTKLEILMDRNINKLQQIKFYIFFWINLDP